MPYQIQGSMYTDSTVGGSPSYLDGTVFVPLKGVIETLGGNATFNGNAAKVILNNVLAHLTSSQVQVQLVQGSNTVTITLPVESNGQGENIFVPIEFFYQAFSIPVAGGNGSAVVHIG